VVAEHSAPIQGGYAALVGTYDPLVEKHGLKVNTEAVTEWIKKGAKPTNTLARLLKGQGVPEMEKFIVEMKNKKVKNPKEQPEAPAAPAAESPKVDEAPAEVAPETPAPEAPQPEEKPVETTEEKPADAA